MSNRDVSSLPSGAAFSRSIFIVIAIATAYCVSGKLGLMLAIPPGYATAVFPASGIALAALLVFGSARWPGVWLGSFVMNLWVAYSHQDALSSTAIIIAAFLATGASLQALSGAWLVRKVLGDDTRFSDEKSIAALLFLGGVCSCVVAATFGVTTLYSAGVVPSTDFATNWITWWIGDVLGVLTVTPVALAWFAEPKALWRTRRTTVTLPLVALFALTVGLFQVVSSWEQTRLTSHFQRRAQTVASSVAERFESVQQMLDGVARFVATTGAVTAESFHFFVTPELNRRRDIQAIEWVQILSATQRAQFEDKLFAEHMPNISIVERSSDGSLVRAASRDQYYPVTYVEPRLGNERAVAFDLGSEPTRRQTLLAAIEAGQQRATARVRLVQDGEERWSALIFQPVYAVKEQPSGAGVMPRPTGLVLAVLRVGEILNAVLTNMEARDVLVDLRDLSSPDRDEFVKAASRNARVDPYRYDHTFNVADRQWQLNVWPSEEYLARQDVWQAWSVLAGGMLFTGLLGMFLLSLTGRTARVSALVDERTEELANSEARYRSVVESVRDIIFQTDHTGVLTFLSPAWQEVLGHEISTCLGKSVASFVHPDDRSQCATTLHLFSNALQQDRTFEVRTLNVRGETRWLEVHVRAVVDRSGRFSGVAGTMNDVSERREAEKLKREFVSIVSHELRTPLTAIRGSLGLITSGALGAVPAKVAELLDIAMRNSLRLINLINDILDVEKIESGKMTFNFKLQILDDLVRQTIEANRGYGVQNGVRFKLENDAAGVVVKVDPDRFAQVMANLLSNAAKFSPAGETVTVQLSRQGQRVRIAIGDKGPGIPAEFHARIFQKFSQADSSDTRAKGGTGLGLSIAKAIVERTHGTIGFFSELGKGSTFFVDLPAEESAHVATAVAGAKEASLAVTPSKVLHVEDNADVRAVVASIVGAEAVVEVATSLAEAIKKLQATHYCLAILDMDLPDGSGTEVMRWLANHNQKLPIVVFSAQEPELRTTDVVEVLRKSETSNAQLLSAVKKHLI